MTFDMKNRTTLYKFYSRRPAERVVHKLSYEEGTRWNHNQAQWGFYPSHATLNGFQHNAMDAILSGAWDNHSVDCVGFDATEGQQVFRVNLPSPEHSRIILWMGRQVLRFYTVFPAVGGLLTGGEADSLGTCWHSLHCEHIRIRLVHYVASDTAVYPCYGPTADTRAD